METIKAIIGTIIAVAFIVGICAISGTVWLIAVALTVVVVAISIVVSIFYVLREEFKEDKGIPPDL